jgi:flagellar biosynthesis/type III secretory pathway protein FliH
MEGPMATAKHRYESCRDRDCQLPYCVIWREARAEGYEEGFEDGYAAGAASAGE